MLTFANSSRQTAQDELPSPTNSFELVYTLCLKNTSKVFLNK